MRKHLLQLLRLVLLTCFLQIIYTNNILSQCNAGPDRNACGGDTIILQGTPNTGTWAARTSPPNPSGATLTSLGSGSARVSFTNTASGTFAFVYTVGSCRDTMLINVTAKPNAGPDRTACRFGSTTMAAAAYSGATWSASSANPGSATITSPSSPTTTIAGFTANGTYTFFWCGSGCCDTALITVTAPNAGRDTFICQPSTTINLGAAGSGNSWSFGGGPASATVNASTGAVSNMTANGNYTFILTTTSTGCRDSILVSRNPQPANPTPSNNSPICLGDTLLLTATVVSGATSYFWTGPLGFTSTSRNPVVTNPYLQASGNYTAYAVQNGCLSSGAPTSVTVIIPPSSLDLGPSQIRICQGSTETLSATPGWSNYIFRRGGTIVQSGSSNLYTTSVPGQYTVEATMAGGRCFRVSDTVTISTIYCCNNCPRALCGSVLEASIRAGDSVLINLGNYFEGSGTYTVTKPFSNGTGSPNPTTGRFLYRPNSNLFAGKDTLVFNLTASGCPTIRGTLIIDVKSYSFGPNLVTNGNFSAGYTGFTSDYSFTGGPNPPGSGPYPPDGNFALNQGDNNYSPPWPTTLLFARSFTGDPAYGISGETIYAYYDTGPGGPFSSSNPIGGPYASGTCRPVMWRQTITGLSPNTTYEFFAYFDNLIRPSPGPCPNNTRTEFDPTIRFSASPSGISGTFVPLGPTVTIDECPDVYRRISYYYTTGPSQTQVVLIIEDITCQSFGDDVAVASINFRQVQAPPAFSKIPSCSSPCNLTANPGTSRTICQNQQTQIGSVYGAGFSIQWNTISGSYTIPFNRDTVTISIPSPGSYLFCMTVTDTLAPGQGCAASDTIRVNVLSNPSSPTISSNSPVCSGDTLRLFANSVSGATYNWSGPGGFTSTSQNPVRPNANTGMGGTYSAFITVNGCNSPTSTLSVNVIQRPDAGPDRTACQFGSVTMGASAYSGASWSASSGNPGSATITTPSSATTTITGFSTSGTYMFFWCGSGCCDTALVTVTAKPNAGSDRTACGGDTINISGSPGTGTWTARSSPANPSGATLTNLGGGLGNVSFTASSSGTYGFVYTASGCTDTMLINVTPKPDAGPDRTACQFGSVTMGASAYSGA
ncbi:MAG: hypothetical protein RMJ53_07125, partial [Chitinophagales bacterium]|nr:hypothetical protein [Chitinophagales bacterium]